MESLTNDGLRSFSDITYSINGRRYNLKLMNIIQ